MTGLATATILVDADNTLWDTNAVYVDAQLNLLTAVERELQSPPLKGDRLAFVRLVDQGIANRHHARLRYPPRLLVQGLVAALGGATTNLAVRAALAGTPTLPGSLSEGLERDYFRDLSADPALRPGVAEGLAALKSAGATVMVVTEGGRDRVIATAGRLGIGGYIDRFVDAPKGPELFTRVLRLSAVTPRVFMVGDQLDRDIAPAKQAGAVTVYFQGNFRPSWAPDADEVIPDYTVSSFADVPALIIAHDTSTVNLHHERQQRLQS